MQDKTIKLETYKVAKRKGFVELIGSKRPTQTCLQKWLREDKNIYLFVNLRTINNKIGFGFEIISEHNDVLQNIRNWNKEISDKYYGGVNKGEGIVFETFEDALEEGLIVSLNLILNMDNNKINIRILKWHFKVDLNWKCSFEYNPYHRKIEHGLFAIYTFKPFKK